MKTRQNIADQQLLMAMKFVQWDFAAKCFLAHVTQTGLEQRLNGLDVTLFNGGVQCGLASAVLQIDIDITALQQQLDHCRVSALRKENIEQPINQKFTKTQRTAAAI